MKAAPGRLVRVKPSTRNRNQRPLQIGDLQVHGRCVPGVDGGQAEGRIGGGGAGHGAILALALRTCYHVCAAPSVKVSPRIPVSPLQRPAASTPPDSAKAGYIADRSLATVLYLALRMGRPLFVEGEAGVGKTEIAKVLSAALGRRLIRLQCYEGLDVSSAVYEWNYGAQMIAIRLAEVGGEHDRARIEHDVFSEHYLIKRPLLQALEVDPNGPPVLLIDEIDRTDEAFEAFLLEVLADFQVTVPELGTVKAAHPPIVLVTSNRTREVHDALKRRCLYHWIGYPNAERELKILRAKVPGIPKKLSEQVVAFVQALRKEDLFKSPGVAETLDWAGALTELDVVALDPATVSDTLGALLKYQDDIARLDGSKVKALLDEVKSELRAAE
jgi:MoxR-like ATPase